jgi:integrase/recombinase XerD
MGEMARRGRSRATRTAYRRILETFADRYPKAAVHELAPEDCRRFLDQWKDAAPSTMAQRVSILAGFFAWLYQEGIIEENPMARVKRPPQRRPEDVEVVSVSVDEVERIFAACDDWQELLCISTAAYLGPRRSAIAAVRRKDADLQAGTVRFREKGGKVVVKPVPDEYLAILRAAEANGVWASPEDYLVPNRRPASVRRSERSDKVVWETVKRVARRAGVTSHVHALRAAFAVRYLETHPGDVEALKALLGHERLETTQVYLRRLDRSRAMDRVRDLSWGSVFPPSSEEAHTGFEPVLPP